MNAQEIINSVKTGDSQEIENSTRAALSNKISELLDDKRKEIGDSMFTSEETDPVKKKSAKKDFDDRKDKDIDNDGDVDDSDEYLHKRRKAIAKNKDKKDD